MEGRRLHHGESEVQQAKFSVFVRVPNRSVSELYTTTPEVSGYTSLAVNGKAVPAKIDKGYVQIDRKWKKGDKIDFVLPLAVQRIKADEQVAADRGRVALRYGPLIYNFEAVDQADKTLNNRALAQTRRLPPSGIPPCWTASS